LPQRADGCSRVCGHRRGGTAAGGRVRAAAANASALSGARASLAVIAAGAACCSEASSYDDLLDVLLCTKCRVTATLLTNPCRCGNLRHLAFLQLYGSTFVSSSHASAQELAQCLAAPEQAPPPQALPPQPRRVTLLPAPGRTPRSRASSRVATPRSRLATPRSSGASQQVQKGSANCIHAMN